MALNAGERLSRHYHAFNLSFAFFGAVAFGASLKPRAKNIKLLALGSLAVPVFIVLANIVFIGSTRISNTGPVQPLPVQQIT